jgi:hypothetical protein
MNHHATKNFLRILGATALLAAFAISVASCNNNQGGFSGNVGNTPNAPPLTSYRILGTPGTPFTATVSNARSSWTLQGNIPLSMIICNNVLPARIIATKTSSDTNLMSVEIINGTNLLHVASTQAPFGTVSLQTSGSKVLTISPPANPDLRIFLAGPLAAPFSALVEDIQTGFVISDTAPTLIFFDTPNGKVDATFIQGGGKNFGSFTINMTLNGAVVATVTGGPSVTIREP